MTKTTVNIEQTAAGIIKLNRVVAARNGTQEEFHQGIANAVNLGIEYQDAMAALLVSIALDTRRIADALENLTTDVSRGPAEVLALKTYACE